MHGDSGGRSDIDRTRRAELGDGQHGTAGLPGHRCQAIALLPEHQDAGPRKVRRLERYRAREVVDADQRQIMFSRPSSQACGILVMTNMLVAVGHHRPAPVPAPASHDVHLFCEESIGRAHDGTDVEVVTEVLDRHVERVSALIQVIDDRLKPPVAVTVHHIAAVTLFQQVRVEPVVTRPFAHPRPHTHQCVVRFHRHDDSLTAMHSTAAAVLALGPDIQGTLESMGDVGFWVVVAIIFAECGLLIGFFLPGDSLLFITGLLIASGTIGMNIAAACLILFVAALVGNITGYWIGYKAGPSLFNRPNSRLFRQEYVDKTHAFFEKYGARAIILARFVPIVRTFITATAGIGRMPFGRYLTFSAIGGLLWAIGVTLAGYWLGNIEFVKKNIELILIGIVVVSVLPIVIEFIRHRRERSAA